MAIELLAPYGGITRIRFKGSSEFLRTSQPMAPPLYFRIGAVAAKSMTALGGRAPEVAETPACTKRPRAESIDARSQNVN